MIINTVSVVQAEERINPEIAKIIKAAYGQMQLVDAFPQDEKMLMQLRYALDNNDADRLFFVYYTPLMDQTIGGKVYETQFENAKRIFREKMRADINTKDKELLAVRELRFSGRSYDGTHNYFGMIFILSVSRK
jgi:hypothetical protein